MKKYMLEHIANLRKRLEHAETTMNWSHCIKIEGQILEAEYLWDELMQRGLL